MLKDLPGDTAEFSEPLLGATSSVGTICLRRAGPRGFAAGAAAMTRRGR